MRKNKSHSEKKNASIRDLDLSNRLICDKKCKKIPIFGKQFQLSRKTNAMLRQ